MVRRFKCGGFALGFTTNHGILDGKFHNLASICRGETLKTQIIHNDRASIRARNPPQIKFTHKEYIKLPKNISSFPASFTSQNQSSPSPSLLVFSNNYAYDHKPFRFTPSIITSLKQKAMAKCSSFETIVAHIWNARTKAVFKNPDEFRQFSLQWIGLGFHHHCQMGLLGML
ncbi:Omega-hydroxypalmitate O-feruloyl transferase [Camellia lanceoleosa]|uniref:Omega-hydroxypalmitate O-feruloyl transferase n=1 Tax=Camellia lanceoleosa TaxID=1840588 RepID=A0ACC0GR85_9ERIC|nr:Omega-hydroxypalmitate O-feruloyl transferase [Camellia lanceoleosa]